MASNAKSGGAAVCSAGVGRGGAVQEKVSRAQSAAVQRLMAAFLGAVDLLIRCRVQERGLVGSRGAVIAYKNAGP